MTDKLSCFFFVVLLLLVDRYNSKIFEGNQEGLKRYIIKHSCTFIVAWGCCGML